MKKRRLPEHYSATIMTDVFSLRCSCSPIKNLKTLFPYYYSIIIFLKILLEKLNICSSAETTTAPPPLPSPQKYYALLLTPFIPVYCTPSVLLQRPFSFVKYFNNLWNGWKLLYGCTPLYICYFHHHHNRKKEKKWKREILRSFGFEGVCWGERRERGVVIINQQQSHKNGP